MADWLPQDWEVKDLDGKAERALQGVRRREARRRRVVRTSGIAAAFSVALLSLYTLPGLLRPSTGNPIPAPGAPGTMARLQSPAPAAASDPTGSVSSSPISHPQAQVPRPPSEIRNPPSQGPLSPPAPRLTKAGAAVEVTWPGDPEGEYVVYRCTRPTFDACQTAGVVRGTRWTDREMNDSPIVFYKVEPKA